MTALTNQCPCASRRRIPPIDDTTDPGPYAANSNVVCVYCERVLRITSRGKKPERESEEGEVRPSERGQIRAAQARATVIRGKPVDNPPPRHSNGRPPARP